MKKKLWYEDECLWSTFEPTMFNQERLDSTTVEIDHVIKLLDIEKNARILDLGCGIGRHSLELAHRGYQVIGVDLTECYLTKARRQADIEGLAIEFIRKDMRWFRQTERFDVVINMFTAFGYFEDPQEDKHVAANMYACLRKGGKLIMDLAGKEVLARIHRERDWYEDNGRIFLRECKMRRNWSWAENRWIMIENGEKKEFKFGHRIYSAVEINNLLNECGFESVSIYGNLSGADYDRNATRLIAVARK